MVKSLLINIIIILIVKNKNIYNKDHDNQWTDFVLYIINKYF